MILKYITLFSGFNFLIFAFILLFKKSPLRKSNAVLGLTFLSMTAFCFPLFYLQNATLMQSSSLLKFYIPIDYVFAMLMGPGIFVYVKMILGQPIHYKKPNIWLHLLPSLPAVVFVVYFVTLPESMRIERLMKNFESLMWQGNTLNGIFYIQMTTYLFVCYHLISKQLKVSKTVVINKYQFDITWLKTFFTIDIIMMIVTAPLCLYIANDYINTLIGQVVMNVQFIYIFFKTVWQNGILPVGQIQEVVTVQVPTLRIAEVPENTVFQEPVLKISNNQADDYFERLTAFMDFEKIYLKPGCTIQDLAEQAKIPQHHLSHILNNRLNKNFFDFINEYRVEAAKRLLIDKNSGQLTIEAIGFECGFGAKSSFNKAFKKLTNQTPSEFRRSLSTTSE
jgi:AraC-like DNA-binding protein